MPRAIRSGRSRWAASPFPKGDKGLTSARRGATCRAVPAPTFPTVDRDLAQLAPDPDTFGRHFALVQDYVSSRPGSHAALMTAAREEPEAMTMSIVALGAVLLDIAAGAF